MNYQTPFSIAVAALLLSISTARSQDPPMNLVIIQTDEHHFGTLGCYGGEIVGTPNIDWIAEQGVTCTSFYATTPVCSPSRASFISGRYPQKTPVVTNNIPLADSVITFAEVLRRRGYATGFAGKWHAKMPRGWKATDHFDVFQQIGRNPFYKKQPDGSLRHETELIVDRGIEFIENQPKDKPFALNMWFNACHAEDGDRRPGVLRREDPHAHDEALREGGAVRIARSLGTHGEDRDERGQQAEYQRNVDQAQHETRPAVSQPFCLRGCEHEPDCRHHGAQEQQDEDNPGVDAATRLTALADPLAGRHQRWEIGASSHSSLEPNIKICQAFHRCHQ